jgi:beta-lactamase regulating signal transducer with metallopeptidase domain
MSASVFDSDVVDAVGWALLHFLWQGALIAGGLELALACSPRSRSSLRYAACCVALAAMLAAPVLTLWYLLGSAHAPSRAQVAPGGVGAFWLPALTGAWGLGSLTMTARLVVGFCRLRSMVKRAALVGGGWQRRLGELAQRVGLRQHVRLLASIEVDAPLLVGCLRPVILVPLGALGALPAAYLEALLLHELGHVRRLDYLANLMQACVEAALFYHPAVHWVSARLRVEREHCCDDLVIRVTGDRLEYARALTTMETLRVQVQAPALAANGGSLLTRVERIVGVPATSPGERRASFVAAVAVAVAVGLSVAGVWCSRDAGATQGEASLGIGIPWLPPSVERWAPAFVEAAHRHSVDPALLAIVTLVESLGDPTARSPRGAIGLMQLLPSTAAQIAAERGLRDYTAARLFDPECNVDLGAAYLSDQYAAFGLETNDPRSIALAAIAYNGGPGLARGYLDGTLTLREETRKYRDLVLGMWNERKRAESPTFSSWRERL